MFYFETFRIILNPSSVKKKKKIFCENYVGVARKVGKSENYARSENYVGVYISVNLPFFD